MRSLWCVFLVFLVASQYVNAKNKDPNDPNKQLLAKWDAVIRAYMPRRITRPADGMVKALDEDE